jgi:hypothetical protein
MMRKGPLLVVGAGKMPGQIAEQLRGRSFKSFKEFREEFWKLVEKDPDLGPQFSAQNRALMREGKAPVPPGEFQTGKGAANRSFNLDDIDTSALRSLTTYFRLRARTSFIVFAINSSRIVIISIHMN